MSPRVRVEARDGLISLNIQSALPEDSGVYRILVRNPFSEITSSCTLNVYESIKPTNTPPLFTSSIKGMSSTIDSKTIHRSFVSHFMLSSKFEVSSDCLYSIAN